jgi:RNA polymerase sigma-70 factor (sigma-E family)
MGAIASERAEAEVHAAGRLADVYARNAPAAVRLAYLITSDAELARDIAQDAFVRVAGRLGHLRVPDAFDAYLRRSVVNLCTTYFRRRRIERAYLQRAAAEPGGELPAPDVGVRDELRTALRSLPARQRTAIVLRYYEDLSEQQVADAMRCSVPAARSLIGRGMHTLRALIEGDEDQR